MERNRENDQRVETELNIFKDKQYKLMVSTNEKFDGNQTSIN